MKACKCELRIRGRREVVEEQRREKEDIITVADPNRK